MNNFIFENSSKVYFGEGCVKEYLSNILSAYGDTVMLCYGGGSIKKNGIYDEVITVLKKANKAVVEFSGIPSNPTYGKVLEGVKLAKESNADLILAVGGGSVMDCCKAISLGAKYDGDIWSDFWARPGVIDFEPLPLGMIVTVSGTGSECNGGAVITNEELKIKTGKIILSLTQNSLCLTRPTPTAFLNFKWYRVPLILFHTLWKSISASRMKVMYRTIYPRLL